MAQSSGNLFTTPSNDPTSVQFTGTRQQLPSKGGLLTTKGGSLTTNGDNGSGSQFGAQVKQEGFRQGINLIEEGIGGFADAQGLKPQSEILDFNAKQVELAGEQQGIEILKNQNDIQAANVVAAFASGIQLSGSIQTGFKTVERKAAFARGLSSANSAIRAGALRREAKRLKAEARYNKQIAPLKIITGATIIYFSAGQG